MYHLDIWLAMSKVPRLPTRTVIICAVCTQVDLPSCSAPACEKGKTGVGAVAAAANGRGDGGGSATAVVEDGDAVVAGPTSDKVGCAWCDVAVAMEGQQAAQVEGGWLKVAGQGGGCLPHVEFLGFRVPLVRTCRVVQQP